MKRTAKEKKYIDAVKRLLDDDDGDYEDNGGGGGDSYSGSESNSGSGSGSESNSGSESESEFDPAPTPLPAGPRITINPVAGIGNIRYILPPVYTASGRVGAGGTCSVATLGPAGAVSKDSDADRSKLPKIIDAEQDYDETFVAGHLLNAQFGGSGTDPTNLTILTQSANHSMCTFDNAIASALREPLTHAYECVNSMGLDVSTLGYGIQVTVTADDAFWSDDQSQSGYLITTGVTSVAVIVAEPDPHALENALTQRYGQNRVTKHGTHMANLEGAIASLRERVADANNSGRVDNVNPGAG